MENDPIDEAAEADPEQDPGRAEPGDRVGLATLFFRFGSTTLSAGRHAGTHVTGRAVSETRRKTRYAKRSNDVSGLAPEPLQLRLAVCDEAGNRLDLHTTAPLRCQLDP